VDPVCEEVEGREGWAELEDVAEGLDAPVVETVPAEVEDCETHERTEQGNEGEHAVGAQLLGRCREVMAVHGYRAAVMSGASLAPM
jgi:hypothetical protein